MSVDDITAIRWVIGSWNIRELAAFAEHRIGYQNTDHMVGIHYPDDLDDYDREVAGIDIPKGWVAVVIGLGEWRNVPERLYLEILVEELEAKGMPADAARVRALMDK
jgi:hypothetical protein